MCLDIRGVHNAPAGGDQSGEPTAEFRYFPRFADRTCPAMVTMARWILPWFALHEVGDVGKW